MAREVRLQVSCLMVLVVPLLCLVAAVVIFWNTLVGPGYIVLLVVLYVTSALGVSVGYHRLLTHRSFRTRPWVRYTPAVLGSMAVEDPPIEWVATHRRHHALADADGDPHSPHEYGPGPRGALRGLVRIFLIHHVTPSIDSICHFFGARRFATHDESRNVGWLGIISFGESRHNNHHAFPAAAYIGTRAREIDIARLVIHGLERSGPAWHARRISPQLLHRKTRVG